MASLDLKRRASLPRTVEQLTPDWLTSALRRRQPGVTVKEASVEDIIWGTATKVFMRLELDGEPGGIPERVCIKGGLDERLREFGLDTAYELEGCFYRDLAPTLGSTVPRSFFADAEPGQGIVVLEDLTGAEFGNAREPWSPDRVAEALEVQASWHAPTFGERPGSRFDWLVVGCQAARNALVVMTDEEHFEPLLSRPEVPDVSGPMADRERVRRAYRELWRRDDEDALCLNHGDAHLAQLYVREDGRPAFLDWQAPCLAPWSHDVTYFMGSALSIEDRRAHERDLLEHYLQALAAFGGPRIAFADAWEDYRRHTLHGFAWLVTPAVMQPPEVVGAMAERYAAAIEDHDPFEALGV